ncbi:hypothetical protein [Sodalis sp. RH22]|uniref:hypothetical protein n=1 Tax=unclassified Sodalis (in: enterobacteria) TaxID=2636512 RepID=UPI0039B65930
MWSVDCVIGENGSLFSQRASNGHGVMREFWHAAEDLPGIRTRLDDIALKVKDAIPDVTFADDQLFRLTGLAFARPGDKATAHRLADRLRAVGTHTTINNLWILGWLGDYDKLAMTRRILADMSGVDIDSRPETVLYTEDSTNDALMFSFFPHSVGISTVRQYLHEIPTPSTGSLRGLEAPVISKQLTLSLLHMNIEFNRNQAEGRLAGNLIGCALNRGLR